MANEPKMIQYFETIEFIESMPNSVKSPYLALTTQGWKFYIVAQSRGYCAYQWKTITIPQWVMKKPIGEQIWYFAHEMAHAYSPKDGMHGPEFMAQLIRICPAEHIHWELTYKPRNAKAAGIREKDYIDTFSIL